MFVLNELKKSIKAFENIIKEINKVNNVSDFDSLEVKAQKIVFELQMKANQVAGEVVPQLHAKRTELTSISADKVRERLANLQNRVKEKIKEKEEENERNELNDNNDNLGIGPSDYGDASGIDPAAEPEDKMAGERDQQPVEEPKEEVESQQPVEEPKEEVESQQPVEEPKEEDGGNDNRQPEPESGNGKPESTKKAK